MDSVLFLFLFVEVRLSMMSGDVEQQLEVGDDAFSLLPLMVGLFLRWGCHSSRYVSATGCII